MLITYFLFRLPGAFLSLLPYRLLHALACGIGSAAFYLHRNFRKKALSNLAIAYGASKSEKERKAIAKASFQNVAITCLEFFRLKRSKGNLSKVVTLVENQEVRSLLEKKQGVIFLTAHQANWEIPFIAITDLFQGVAIGRPIKNRWLYKWVLSVREMNGGKILMPRQAIRQGVRALKAGKFLGIVGDQAFPESPYAYPLFGTRAWTASTPALLAYKTKCPIIVGTTQRIGHKYVVNSSSPFWADLSNPVKEEVPLLMDRVMSYLEKSLQKNPEQWMWIHDRWKQQGIDHVKRKYRFGFVLITLPPDPTPFLEILPLLRRIYPRSFLSFLAPQGTQIPLPDCNVITYEKEEDLFMRDWRFQIVLDFYNSAKLRRHYRRLGAFKTLSIKKMRKIAPDSHTLTDLIKKTLVKPECLKIVSS
ncbi:MAG: hypothetical protein WAM28_08855 [Chlamydiales bacterium]